MVIARKHRVKKPSKIVLESRCECVFWQYEVYALR